MTLDLIRQFYRFNTWANARILDTSALLNPDQYRAESNPSFGSIHNTLVHIMSAQWVWLSRWKGISPKSHLSPDDFSNLAALRARWDEVELDTQSFVAACTEDKLAAPLSYINPRGESFSFPLWQMMLHQVNHATQHRSEVAMILTNFEHSPGAMDFLYFLGQEAHPSP